jgi:hypothetical protein
LPIITENVFRIQYAPDRDKVCVAYAISSADRPFWDELVRRGPVDPAMTAGDVSNWMPYFRNLWNNLQNFLVVNPEEHRTAQGRLTCTSSLFIFKGMDYGVCGTECVVCSPECGGSGGKHCITPGHMSLSQAALRASIGFGLCTTCHRYFATKQPVAMMRRDLEAGVTREGVEAVRMMERVRASCKDMMIKVHQHLNPGPAPLPVGLGFQTCPGQVGPVMSNGHLSEVLAVQLSRQCERRVGSHSLSQFQYCCVRLMAFHTSFSAYVNEARSWALGQRLRLIYNNGVSSKKAGMKDGLALLDKLEMLHCELCVKKHCSSRVGTRLAFHQRKGPDVWMSSCRGCSIRFRIAFELMTGLSTPQGVDEFCDQQHGKLVVPEQEAYLKGPESAFPAMVQGFVGRFLHDERQRGRAAVEDGWAGGGMGASRGRGPAGAARGGGGSSRQSQADRGVGSMRNSYSGGGARGGQGPAGGGGPSSSTGRQSRPERDGGRGGTGREGGSRWGHSRPYSGRGAGGEGGWHGGGRDGGRDGGLDGRGQGGGGRARDGEGGGAGGQQGRWSREGGGSGATGGGLPRAQRPRDRGDGGGLVGARHGKGGSRDEGGINPTAGEEKRPTLDMRGRLTPTPLRTSPEPASPQRTPSTPAVADKSPSFSPNRFFLGLETGVEFSNPEQGETEEEPSVKRQKVGEGQ